jgi:hypothetical protein
VNRSTAYRIFKKLNFSYITPRPIRHKKNEMLEQAAKKNIDQEIEKNPGQKVFFFDEARFGNRVHGWESISVLREWGG